MKNILLTTTALVAFAGAAAADGHSSIKFSIDAEFGYNNSEYDSTEEFIKNKKASEVARINADATITDKAAAIARSNTALNNAHRSDDFGFYWDADLDAKATHELDNGITAGAEFSIAIANESARDAATPNTASGLSKELAATEYTLSLTSNTASLYFGDVEPAASKHWTAAGDMEADRLSEDPNSNVLRGDATFANIDTSVSLVWADDENEIRQLSLGGSTTLGAISLAAVYQEDSAQILNEAVDSKAVETNNTQRRFQDDFNGAQVIGVSAKGTFMGATVTGAVAHAKDKRAFAGTGQTTSKAEATSVGVNVEYPVGPVTTTVYYVHEIGKTSAGADISDLDPNYGVKFDYEGNGVSVTADFQDDQGTQKWDLDGSYGLTDSVDLLAGVGNTNEGDADYYVGATYDLGNGAEALFAYAEDEDGNQDDEIGANDLLRGVTVQVSFAF